VVVYRTAGRMIVGVNEVVFVETELK